MTNELQADASNDAGPAIPICPKCLAEALPWADFCLSCRTPITAFANTGYMESAFAEGWGIGEAIVTKQPTLATLLGLWLLLTPTLLGLGLALTSSPGEALTWLGALGRLVAAGVIAFLGWALFHGTRNYVRARRKPADPGVS